MSRNNNCDLTVMSHGSSSKGRLIVVKLLYASGTVLAFFLTNIGCIFMWSREKNKEDVCDDKTQREKSEQREDEEREDEERERMKRERGEIEEERGKRKGRNEPKRIW